MYLRSSLRVWPNAITRACASPNPTYIFLKRLRHNSFARWQCRNKLSPSSLQEVKLARTVPILIQYRFP